MNRRLGSIVLATTLLQNQNIWTTGSKRENPQGRNVELIILNKNVKKSERI